MLAYCFVGSFEEELQLSLWKMIRSVHSVGKLQNCLGMQQTKKELHVVLSCQIL